jgi:hypothetical protein
MDDLEIRPLVVDKFLEHDEPTQTRVTQVLKFSKIKGKAVIRAAIGLTLLPKRESCRHVEKARRPQGDTVAFWRYVDCEGHGSFPFSVIRIGSFIASPLEGRACTDMKQIPCHHDS